MCKPIDQAAAPNHDQLAQRPESGSIPRDRYLNYVNGTLSLLILLNSAALKEEKGVHEGFWLLCTLPARKSMKTLASTLTLKVFPAVIFVVVMAGRRNLRSIDLTELENLKYEYKGA